MPNRIIRESICCSSTCAQLSADGERLFVRLITQADDFGRFDARLPVLRSRCFQLGGVSDAHMGKWLRELYDVGLIRLYTDNGHLYGHFITWEKYQLRRARTSKYPPPTDENICKQMPSDANGCEQKLALFEDPDPDPDPRIRGIEERGIEG